jgi:DNA repair exonuclease SbcCD ATPase subunit
LRNAYIFKECHVPLADQGLVQIRGLNLDDGGFLGVGKSSLFNGFSRIQFGKSGKQDLVDDIIHDQVGKNLEKVLRLRKDGKPLELRQYRKHDLYGTTVQVIDVETGEDILPDSARKHPQSYIRDHVLGIDETTAFNVLYLRQDFNHAMLLGKPGERRQTLTTMFGLSFYDEVHSQVKSHIRVLQSQLGKISSYTDRLEEVNSKLAKLGSLKKLRKRYKTALKRVEAYQAGWYVSTNELEEAQELLSQLALRYNHEKELAETWDYHTNLADGFGSVNSITEDRVEDLDRKRHKVEVKCSKLEAKVEGARKRKILVSQLKDNEKELDGLDSSDAVDDEIADIKSRLHYLTTIELPASEKLEGLQSRLNKLPPLPKDVSSVEERYSELREEEQSLESAIRRDKTQLDDGVCSECNRPLTLSEDEHMQIKNRLAKSRKRLKIVRSQVYDLKTTTRSISDHKRLQDKIDNLPTTRGSSAVQDEIDQLRKKERRLSKLAELHKTRGQLEQQIENLPNVDPTELEKKVKKHRNRKRSLKNLVKAAEKCLSLQRTLEDLPMGDRKDVRAKVKELRSEIRSLGTRIEKWSRKVSKLESKIGSIEDLRDERRQLEKKLDEVRKSKMDLDCYETLKRVFGPKGLKQDRFESILQEAAERTIPAYTDILWPHKNVDLHLDAADDLQFYLKRRDSSKLTKGSLISGGETHKAGLAFLLGLRDLKELYTDTSFNILIIDEPFGNLDPQGEEALLSILEMLKERFSSIFVISHRPEVLNSDVWDQTWWVIREKGFSTLYTEPPPERYDRIAQSFMVSF